MLRMSRWYPEAQPKKYRSPSREEGISPASGAVKAGQD